MSSTQEESPLAAEPTPVTPVVALPRRRIDALLIGVGAVMMVVFLVAGGLLTWGANFSDDYVTKELSSQNISFPDAAALKEEGRNDLLEFAGQRLTTGDQAEGYASFINGHLQHIADGATYADLGGPESAANNAVKDAVAANAPQDELDALKATAAGISGQRNTLFKGETLRGLLLTAYAWSTVGTIAGIAAIGAFVAAAIMAVLVILGVVHYRRTIKTA